VNQLGRIDLHALVTDAEASDHGEAYRVLERSAIYRIGVGARLPPSGPTVFFIEVLVHACQDAEVDLRLLEQALRFFEALKARGYSLRWEDDASVSGEIVVSPQTLASEYEALSSQIKQVFLDDP